MKKWTGIAILIAVLGVIGWWVLQLVTVADKGSALQRPRMAVAVEVAPVQTTAIRKMGSFTGTLNPISEYVIAPKIAGRLEKILVNIGDKVESGQLVAVLDDAEHHQQVIQARAELEVTRANLKERENILASALREFERTVALREKKIASESQLDAATSEFKTQQARMDVAVAQVAQKDAALKMAEVRLSYTQIRLPQTGAAGHRVVGERFVDEGAMLSANKEIVSILDISTVIAVIQVIERDYPYMRLGLGAEIATDAYPQRTFTGKVVRIAPMLKENTRGARVEVEIPNQDKLLKPGMFVRVSVEFDQHDNATVITRDALIRRNGTSGVFVADLEAKQARFVAVTVGIVSADQVQIVAPPLKGMVVTLGHHLLEDGAAILLPESKGSAKGDPSAPPKGPNASGSGPAR